MSEGSVQSASRRCATDFPETEGNLGRGSAQASGGARKTSKGNQKPMEGPGLSRAETPRQSHTVSTEQGLEGEASARSDSRAGAGDSVCTRDPERARHLPHRRATRAPPLRRVGLQGPTECERPRRVRQSDGMGRPERVMARGIHPRCHAEVAGLPSPALRAPGSCGREVSNRSRWSRVRSRLRNRFEVVRTASSGGREVRPHVHGPSGGLPESASLQLDGSGVRRTRSSGSPPASCRSWSD
jgi:hypothetical protein